MLVFIEEVVSALNQADVRYLVVGGVAVLLHGHLRPIVGLDLVVQLEPQNAGRAIGALGALGFKPRVPLAATAFVDAAARRRWARDKGLTVLSFWSPSRAGFEVGLAAEEPFEFDAAFNRAHKLPLGATFAQVPSITDLITLRRAAGKDLEDIPALEALRDSQGQRDAPPVAKIRDRFSPR